MDENFKLRIIKKYSGPIYKKQMKKLFFGGGAVGTISSYIIQVISVSRIPSFRTVYVLMLHYSFNGFIHDTQQIVFSFSSDKTDTNRFVGIKHRRSMKMICHRCLEVLPKQIMVHLTIYL